MVNPKFRIFKPCILILIFLFCNSICLAQQISPQKISLDIKGMDIVDVFKMLAERSGMNIVVGKNVTGRVTFFLKDVVVDDAFEIILLANDLACDKKGNIINVMTQRDYELIYGERYLDTKQAKVIQLKYAKAVDLSRALTQIKTNIGKIVADETSNTLVLVDVPEKLKEMEDFIQSADLPVQTRIFNLNYAQVDKIQAKIQETLTKAVGYVRIDERTNKIAVTDYPAKLDEIAGIISAFDEKTPQVLIDAQIIEIKPSDEFKMGVNWDYFLREHVRLIGPFPAGSGLNLLKIGTATQVTDKGEDVGVKSPGEYKGVLDILRSIGDVKILSSPRIMALNNQEAKILVGKKDAYITSATSQSGESSVTSQSINFVDSGIKLYVTPTVNRDGFVTMKIRPEISEAELKPIMSEDKKTDAPFVMTSESETTVMVKDGVTLIIGGLKKDKRTKTVNKIPLIGDIPGLGFFFRSTTDKSEGTELVILLTPHIMSGESSYTDFSEIKPKEGVVAEMVKGEIVIEKIKPDSKKILAEENILAYYNAVMGKIKTLALFDRPKLVKGEIDLAFTLRKDGALVGEPSILTTSNPVLNDFAIRTIKNASPFPAFPQLLEKDTEVFRIRLSYK